MRSIRLIFLPTILFSTLILAQSTPVLSPAVGWESAVVSGLSQPGPATQAKVARRYGKVPQLG